MVAAVTIVRAWPAGGSPVSPQHGLVPPADPAWVERPALLEIMNQALQRRLTIVGPGCGKVTRPASWALTALCACYAPGSEDAALPVLIRGLVDALRVWLPGTMAACSARPPRRRLHRTDCTPRCWASWSSPSSTPTTSVTCPTWPSRCPPEARRRWGSP